MQKIHIPAIATLIALLWATPAAFARSDLAPSPDQERITELVTQYIAKYHYKKTPLDDRLSAQILDRYLESLDPNRIYFTAKDIEKFSIYTYQIDNFLRDGRIDAAFEIFEVFRRRVSERIGYALALLNEGFDFGVDESYEFDRSEAAWAPDIAALNDLWRKRVKNDLLGLRLTDEPEGDAIETVTKRYEGMARRTGQSDADDVYQLFMNAYTVSIEPHTAYFSPRTSEDFRIRMSLSLEGIGAALQTENEYTMVRRIIPGGPAEGSGELHEDDRIVGVGQGPDGEIVDVVGWRLQDVVTLIRGPKKSVVRLRLLPKGAASGGPHKLVTLVRDKIKLEDQAAKKSLMEIPTDRGTSRIGVIEIPTFYLDFSARAQGLKDYRSTTRDVRRLLKELTADGVEGIVIDLRGNSGGALAEATELSGLFIKSGPIVQVKDSSGQIDVNVDPDPAIAYVGPLAVLVDRNSASASEIFAAAIQDYGRGVIIGEPTFGKGTVQNLVDLDRFATASEGRLGQLKVTIAQFFRISGGSTQHRGVVPDILFPTLLDASERGERALENALPWTAVQPASFALYGQFGRALDAARTQHLDRIKTAPGFVYLRGEALSQKEVRDRTSVSLLESKRRREFEARETARKARENQFRLARGLSPLSDDDEDKDDANSDAENEDDFDVLLNETARILADLITAGWQTGAILRTADG